MILKNLNETPNWNLSLNLPALIRFVCEPTFVKLGYMDHCG